MTKQREAVNAGIDVGKAQLDICLLERSRMLQVPNEECAIRALISCLGHYRLARIVIEATGRLEQPFLRPALARGFPVVVASPLKVRRTGVAPFNRDSGRLRGKRHIRGGRASTRTALYLKCHVRSPIQPDIKRFYDRLVKS